MTREFIITPEFERRWCSADLGEDELRELQYVLCQNPQSGDMITGTGGLRKLRWAIPGRGKSGGVRVIYVDFIFYEKIYLISAYKKNESVTLSATEKKEMKRIIDQIEAELRKKRES
jgi:hypothetical protein